jgi:hypothetical protein
MLAIPDCWKIGSHTSFGDTPSGLVKMNVNTSFGFESMKDLTVWRYARTVPPSNIDFRESEMG